MGRGGRSNRFPGSRVEHGGNTGNSSPSLSRKETTNPTREYESESENVVDLGRNTPSSRGTRDHSMSDSTTGRGQIGLPVAYVYRDRLFPDGVAATCWPAFQDKMDPTGYNWKVVSPERKESYFQEFKKLYTWPADQETIIKKYWTQMAAKRYSDMISTVVKKCQGGPRPSFIKEAEWPGWLAYWDDEKVKHNAKVNSQNRRTEVDGVGSGCSKHSCGSKCAISHLIDMTKANGGVEPPLYEFERKIHMSKKTNDWVDPKAKRIYDEVKSQVETLKEQLGNIQEESEGAEIEGGSCTVIKKAADKFYLKAAGGVKKRRIYGIGTAGTSLVRENESDITQGSSSSSIEKIVSQKMEVERAEMNEKLKGCEEKTTSLQEKLAQTEEKMEQQSNQLELQEKQLELQGQQIGKLTSILEKLMEMNH